MNLPRKFLKILLATATLFLLPPVALSAPQKKPASTVETIKWDGDCVTLDDFQPIGIDTVEGFTEFPKISEAMKWTNRLKLINDSVIAYAENREFNLLRIANLRTQEVLELLPIMIDGGKGHLASVSQIMPADGRIWLVDWKDNRVGALDYDYDGMFNSMQLWEMPVRTYRMVPQKGNKFAFMDDFKENVRVESLDLMTGETSVISCTFPPVGGDGPLCNYEVQVDMDIAPDMSYFVVATFNWDFIEIYRDGEIKMIRGPFFNETRYVRQGKMKPYMTGSEHRTLRSLRVGNDMFAVGIADEWLDEPKNTVIADIKTILIFSNDGKPLYRLSLPNPIYEFDIDFENNVLLTLEDDYNPKLKKATLLIPK